MVYHLILLASKGLNEQAMIIEVQWVMVNGLETSCRLGFIQCSYLPLLFHHRYIDKVAQVCEVVWDSSNKSPTKCGDLSIIMWVVLCSRNHVLNQHRNPNIDDSFDNNSSSGDNSD